LPRDMDVAIAARLAEISVEDFRALNPSANRPVLLAAGTPQILLPWDNAEVFQRNFETTTLSQMASWTAWIAPSTMKVSDAAKRFNMSEAEFRSLNQIPPRMMIRAGSALLVPRTSRMVEDVTPRVADHGTLDLAPEVVAKRAGKGGKGKSGDKGKAHAAGKTEKGKAIQVAKANTGEKRKR